MKPQDIFICRALSLPDRHGLTYVALAAGLAMNPSDVHAAIKRNVAVGLLDPENRRPMAKPVMEFLVHGLRYVFPVVRGGITRGLPTAHAAPIMAGILVNDSAPPSGRMQGMARFGELPLNRFATRFRQPQQRIRGCTDCWP